MKKKILWILGILILGALGLVIALPFFLEGKMADIIKNKVNQNLNATLDFEGAQLSLIKSFPYAYLDLKGVSLINTAPFEGDTLFSSGDIALDMSIKELFKSTNDPIIIKKLTLDRAKLHIKVNAEENANFDITLEKEKKAPQSMDGQGSDFIFDLQRYVITNTEIIYDDFTSGTHLAISAMNHYGSGDLSLESLKLRTKTDAVVSFGMDSTKYFDKNKVALDALIDIDLKKGKYSFLENKALINQLSLVFDGFVKTNGQNHEIDISFKTPSSDFKNFLAVIPETYASNLDGVTTTGDFEVDGWLKGMVDGDHIPTFKIRMNSDNASFKYPDLPKTVHNVFIDVEVNNKTGIVKDTNLDINRLSFRIDEDRFNLNAKIGDLLGNTTVQLDADGKINLANISQAYPMPDDYGLTGLLAADLTTTFDMASLKKHQYQNTKTSGKVGLNRFHYESGELKYPVDIHEAAMTFNPTTVSLDVFTGKMGQTDFNATGTLTNLLGHMFNNENLEGRFNLRSKTLAVRDFMMDEMEGGEATQESEGATESIKIPGFLDVTIDASANTILYDNLSLKNVQGRLLIKDETVTLENMGSDIFDGKLTMNGAVSTKGDIPVFDMGLGIDGFQIAESFRALELFRALVPIGQAFQGRLNSDIKLSGNLNDDMTPNLGSLSGNLLGQLLSAKVKAKNAPALAALDGQFDFIDFDALDLNALNAALSFDGGKVATKPFAFKYKDITVNIAGSHTFDAKLQYQATLDVPAKYLGAEVNQLMAQINDEGLQELPIPITANIAGNYKNPKVTTDLTSGVSKFTKQLVEIQKQKLVDKGKDKVKDLLGTVLGKDGNSTQTESTQPPGQGVNEVLGGLLGKKRRDSTETDTVTKDNGVKNTAKTILGGLLGRKRDTVD